MTKRACPDCGAARNKTRGGNCYYLHCQSCGVKEKVSRAVYDSIPSLANRARIERHDDEISVCNQPLNQRHAECTGKFLKSLINQEICVWCQREMRRVAR